MFGICNFFLFLWLYYNYFLLDQVFFVHTQLKYRTNLIDLNMFGVILKNWLVI